MAFTFISGNPALDLTGTVGHRRTDRIELLTGPDALLAWFAAADLAFPDTVVNADDLDQVRGLREAVYRLAAAASEGRRYDARARTLVNRLAATDPPLLSIAPDGSLTRRGGTAAAVSLLARSAVELLTGDRAGRIRECAGDECTRLYVDASARGSRRWCDMRLCGNRMKVASFRSRQAEQT